MQHRADSGHSSPHQKPVPSTEAVIRVLLVDHQPVMRHGIKLAVKEAPNIEVVAEAATSDEAIKQAGGLCPDVIVMEPLLPDGGGLAAIRTIKQECPNVRVLVLSSRGDLDAVREATKVGAIGYVLKDIACEKLVSAIQAAYENQTILSPAIAQQLLRQLSSAPIQQTHDGQDRAWQSVPMLSRYDLEVLSRVARGLSDRQIAAQLFLSESAVKSRLRHLYHRLCLKNRAHAVAFAQERGLLTAASEHEEDGTPRILNSDRADSRGVLDGAGV